MNNRKSKVWSITAGIMFSIVVLATIGLIAMVGQLDMLPSRYLMIAGLAVVFVWVVIFVCLFLLPLSFKKKTDKAKSPYARYAFRTVGVLLSAALLAVDIFGMSAVSKLKSTLANMSDKNEQSEQSEQMMQTESTEGEEAVVTEEEIPFSITKDAFLVYISGSDTRGSKLENSRSDVNILAAVNPVTKQVLLINTPRDYYVEISVSKDGERDKLTHCGNYGIDCSMDTLENLYDEEIRYYAQINFKGFTKLIDAIGGVEIYSEKSFHTTEGGYKINKGKNTLDGDEALAYARDRFSYGDGDAARARNQMAIIKGVIDRLSSGAILTKYGEILDSLGEYFGFNLTESEVAELVKMQLTDMAKWNVQTFAVTGKGTSRYTYSIPNAKAYVMIPDEGSVAYAHNLIERIFAGETLIEEDLNYVPGAEESTEAIESSTEEITEFEIERKLLDEHMEDTEIPEVTIEEK